MSEREMMGVADGAETKPDVTGPSDLEMGGEPRGDEGGKPAIAKTVIPFDPRKPNRLMRRQLDLLSSLFVSVGEDLALFLEKGLRDDFTIKLHGVVQERFGVLMEQCPKPSCIYQVQTMPDKAPMIWVLSYPLVFSMIDRYLGGSGEVDPQQRELTSVERGIVDRFTEIAMQALAGRWKILGPMEPRITARFSDATRVEAVKGKEIMLVITLDVHGKIHYGEMTICIPFGSLQNYLESLEEFEEITEAETDGAEWRGRLKRKIVDVEVGLPVVLGSADIPIGQILDLEIDDVIVIDRKISEPVEVRIGSKAAIHGNIGIYNDRLALKVLGIQERGKRAGEGVTTDG